MRGKSLELGVGVEDGFFALQYEGFICDLECMILC